MPKPPLRHPWITSLLLLVTSCGEPPQTLRAPELILHSGKILTLNAESDIAEALAVHHGRIAAVGTNDAVRILAGKETQLIDLDGRTVIPGIIDSHAHPTDDGMHVFRVDLSKVASIGELVQLVGSEVEKKASGEWVTNSGYWGEERLAEKRNPTRFDLDPVSPENPVYLGRGHLGVVNTAAFRALGIDKNTPDPPGGAFERDPETGDLTGRVYETAIDLVSEAVPEPTHEELMAAQRAAFRDLVAGGVTSVRTAASSPEAMRAFLDLKRRGELPVRTSVMIKLNPNLPEEELEERLAHIPAGSGLGDEMLGLWGVKMVADGGSDLAYLREEYVSRPGFHGQLGGSLESFTRTVKALNRYGWRVGIHALGDAAIDLVLDAYEAANEESSIVGKRWAIEHGYFLRPEHYDRIKRLGLILHPQTRHFYLLRPSFLEHYGEDYANMTHPYRTLLSHGIPIAGGADWRVAPSDFFLYMWAATTRKTSDGEMVGTDEKLTREEALRFHTLWAASSTFEEDVKGSLEPGKLADLVVLSADYLQVPEEEILDIIPLMTMVAGKIVFDKKGEFSP